MENISYIIKGCIRKEHKCQKFVYEHYRGFALKIVFRYIYRYERAIDAMNEGFVKLLTNFHKFNVSEDDDDTAVERKLMGWLKTILVNVCIDELRKGEMLPEIGSIPDYVWDIPAASQQADELLLYKELMIQIKQLPPQYRVVFNLYVIDGYTHAEIASMLSIPVGTSKSTLSRARTMLQKSIRQSEEKVCRI